MYMVFINSVYSSKDKVFLSLMRIHKSVFDLISIMNSLVSFLLLILIISGLYYYDFINYSAIVMMIGFVVFVYIFLFAGEKQKQD